MKELHITLTMSWHFKWHLLDWNIYSHFQVKTYCISFVNDNKTISLSFVYVFCYSLQTPGRDSEPKGVDMHKDSESKRCC